MAAGGAQNEFNTNRVTPVVDLGSVSMGGSTTYGWALGSGVLPVTRGFPITATRAANIELGKPTTFRISGCRTFSEVYPLMIRAGGDPFMRQIVVADRRWLWPKTWVAGTYNRRRVSGDTFLSGTNILQNKLILPSVRYAKYTLKNEETVWTAKEVLQDVMDQLGVPLRFKDEPAQVEIEDLFLDDSGQNAVQRVLSELPGSDIYIDYDGTCVLYDKLNESEAALVEELGDEQRSGPQVLLIDRKAIRPSKVVVLFTPEVEMRFNYTEPTDSDSQGTQTRTGNNDDDEPLLTNVAPIPDIELDIEGETLARGSWVAMDKMFPAWGAFGKLNLPVSWDVVRRYAFQLGMLSFQGVWGANPDIPIDPVLLARANTTIAHWRRTFRIAETYVQRLESIRPTRTAILSFVLGAYAPAEVYSDWTTRPTHHGALGKTDQHTDHGFAVRGYNDNLADAKVAPARITPVNMEAGIFTVMPLSDPYGLEEAVHLGYPENEALPSQMLGKANLLGADLYANWGHIKLEPGWKMSTVMTVVPGSPNTVKRFHAVEVSPSQIPNPPGDSDGPVVYVRVFPGVVTARFAWQDAAAQQIKDAVKGLGPLPSSQLVNEEHVQDVAIAAAARLYESTRDRWEGAVTVDMKGDVEPTGSASQVRQTMVNGATVTTVDFTTVTAPADVWKYLNGSTRKAIRGNLLSPNRGEGASS